MTQRIPASEAASAWATPKLPQVATVMVSKPRRRASMAWAKAIRSFWVPVGLPPSNFKNLAQPGFPFDVAGTDKGGVAHFGIDDVLVRLQPLGQRSGLVSGNFPLPVHILLDAGILLRAVHELERAAEK
jgi:hypothetical protein